MIYLQCIYYSISPLSTITYAKNYLRKENVYLYKYIYKYIYIYLYISMYM